jgi:hypothetical protein
MAMRKQDRKRIKVNVYLDAEQYEALNALTEKTHIPWAAVVREGVDMALGKYRKHLKAR